MKVGKESEKLEFKKTTAELREGVISMSAILNKHGGGELYFGIMNDGTPSGQMVSDKTMRDISHKFGDKFGDKQTKELIIDIIRETPTVSARGIAYKIDITPRAVEKNIRELREAGLIERVGSPKSGHWIVKTGG